MTRSTVIVYRITALGNDQDVSYALTPMGADFIAGIISGNGYTPRIKRLRLVDVPVEELEILKSLTYGCSRV